MSDAILGFDLALPAGNNSKSVTKFETPLGLANVSQLMCVVPAGCAGLVGFQFWLGGSPVYPRDGTSFFIFDDFTLIIPVTNQVTTGQWEVRAYNQDFFPHTLHMYYQYDYVTGAPVTQSTPLISL